MFNAIKHGFQRRKLRNKWKRVMGSHGAKPKNLRKPKYIREDSAIYRLDQNDKQAKYLDALLPPAVIRSGLLKRCSLWHTFVNNLKFEMTDVPKF